MKYTVLSIIAFTIISCKSSIEDSAVVRQFNNTDWQCDEWVIESNQEMFIPENLPEEYMVKDLDVTIKYKIRNNEDMCNQNYFVRYIKIIDID